MITEDYIRRNNLDQSSSPYLLQHVKNPVWWQEWSEDLIRYAASAGKPILVSVGYATCHWCHVMASEAFSDPETAEYLNDHFICIKVDREQRPDIDQFMMDFINRQNGRGGWPLNVFLTTSLKPVFALTYAPALPGRSMHSFLSVAEHVFNYIGEHSGDIPDFSAEWNKPSVSDEDTLNKTLSEYYDNVNGGFGTGQKFPTHSTLLYLLYNMAVNESPTIKTICTRTLDAMRLRGLHDHLQGGIFRYCVDSEWTIPHFEKMLYDQAMSVWTYSLAFRVTGIEEYSLMTRKIIRCLKESFEEGGFYISAHDADTDHEEGATYLWSFDELTDVLGPAMFARFSGSYHIEKQGNFEGKNHLLRINDEPLQDIEDRLLLLRRKRKQPVRDDKILCGINALVSVALIQAGRFLSEPEFERQAASLVKRIISKFWDGKSLGHSYRNGILQKQGFLSDAAALLTALTLLYENNEVWIKPMRELTAYVGSFRKNGRWIESDASDFQPVFASWFDHPVPSGVSLAEFALSRVALLSGIDTGFREYLQPFQSDFYNITAMMDNGLFHVITSPDPANWDKMPANSIHVRGDKRQDCYMGTCSILSCLTEWKHASCFLNFHRHSLLNNVSVNFVINNLINIMQTILGANGTIGSVLAKELINYTDKVRLVSRNPKKINPGDELFPADLTEYGAVDQAIAGSEVAYLVVGLDYNLKVWEDKWPKLMRAVIDACIRHNTRLVFFDNIYMYDINEIGHMTEQSEINPPSRKGAVRKKIAAMLTDEIKAGKLMALIARSADFYGPDNERSFVMEIVYKNLKKGKRANWFINADKKHSFTYTPDAARATALLGNTPDAYNQVWHLPTDNASLTGREFIALFAKEMSVDAKVSVMPLWMIKLLGIFIPVLREMPEMLYQYDRDYFFDSSKFDKRFKFTKTNYQEGVRQIVSG